jgi:hypothetical protein
MRSIESVYKLVFKKFKKKINQNNIFYFLNFIFNNKTIQKHKYNNLKLK